MRRWLPAALAALVSLTPIGCTRPAAQLVVVVDTDLVAGTDYTCFGLLVSRLDGSVVEPGATRRFLAVPADATAPFSFGVAPPDGDFRRRVEVAVEALERCDDPAPTDRVVRRAVRTGFLRDQSLRLPLFLPASCGDGCVERESCPATGPECEPPPVVQPEELAPTTPMSELDGGFELPDPADAFVGNDANVPDANVPDANLPDAFFPRDSGPPVDAGPPPACTPLTATGVAGIPTTPVSFTIAPLAATNRLAILADMDSGIGFTITNADGSGVVGQTPLDTAGTGAWGLISVGVPGTDDQIIAAWRNDLARVDRHVIPAGSFDTRTPMILQGSLVDRGVGCALGSDALVVHDEQGLGDPLVLRRIGRTGSATVLYREGDSRHVDLASRADGGALLAMSEVAASPGSCSVVSLTSGGAPSAAVPVPVDTACDRVAIGERTDGAVVLAFVHGSPSRAAYQVLDGGTLAPVGPIVELGPAQAGRMSVTIGAGSFRVTWQDASGLSSRSFADDGTLRSTHCITAAGGAYAEHRAAHVGTTTGIALVASRSISLASLPD